MQYILLVRLWPDGIDAVLDNPRAPLDAEREVSVPNVSALGSTRCWAPMISWRSSTRPTTTPPRAGRSRSARESAAKSRPCPPSRSRTCRSEVAGSRSRKRPNRCREASEARCLSGVGIARESHFQVFRGSFFLEPLLRRNPVFCWRSCPKSFRFFQVFSGSFRSIQASFSRFGGADLSRAARSDAAQIPRWQ